MRFAIVATTAVLVSACVHPPVSQVVAARTVPVRAQPCPATTPLIVVDGAQQPGNCQTNSAASTTTSSCPVGAALYVVDGVRSCGKP